MKNHQYYQKLSKEKDISRCLRKYISKLWRKIYNDLYHDDFSINEDLIENLLIDGNLFFNKEIFVGEDNTIYLYSRLKTEMVSFNSHNYFFKNEDGEEIVYCPENILHIKTTDDLYGISILDENRIEVEEFLENCYKLCLPQFKEIENGIYFKSI